ncbi:MAG: response regulator transcription factor [Pseudomonadota bacterium]
MPVEPNSILILEDVTETRHWLSEILQAVFSQPRIAEAASLQQARDAIATERFELALIDIHLPDGSGMDLLKEVVHTSPTTYCIICTIFGDDQHLFEALRNGARGYLLKDQTSEQLANQLHGIKNGQPPLSPAIARRVLNYFVPSESGNLTPRETEVLTLIAQGLRLKDVAARLGISIYTAGDHVKKIYSKLQIANRAEATLQAARRGLIPPITD